MTAPLLLRGVDVSAFAVALVAKLRGGGVVVSADGPATLVQAMRHIAPQSRTALYWAARLTLVNRAEDLPAFDAVFDAIFADAVLGLDPPALKRGPRPPAAPAPGVAGGDSGSSDGGGLPWTTLPTSISAAEFAETSIAVPDTLPSRLVARADEPFDRFDEDDLRRIGTWLEQLSTRWPRRRTMRREVHRRGKRIDVRESMRSSRTTGWEVLRLARARSAQSTPPGGAGVRCQPFDAAVFGDIPASHARSGGAPERHSSRGFRILDLADQADAGVVASVGGGGALPGQHEGRRPVRRHASRPMRGRAAGRAARQRAARRGGDRRLGRLGQRPAGGPATRAGPGAASGAHGGLAESALRTARIRAAGRIDGGRASVLRSVSARALAVGFA